MAFMIAQNPLLRQINSTNSGICETQLLRTAMYKLAPFVRRKSKVDERLEMLRQQDELLPIEL